MAALTPSSWITLGRIALTPVVVGLLVFAEGRPWLGVAAAAVFLLAALTDFLDGWLARRNGQVTDLGAFLDTTADKLLVTGAVLGLLALGRIGVWVSFVILGRELLIMGLRSVAAMSGTRVPPSPWGKRKFVLQTVALTLAMLAPPIRLGPLRLDEWAVLLAAVVTVASAVDYLVRFRHVLVALDNPSGRNTG